MTNKTNKTMKTIASIVVLAFLLVTASRVCFADRQIEFVSKERAKALGMEIRSKAAGPDAVRVEFEFETKGKLRSFRSVDLEIRDGGKLLVASTLQEKRPGPERIVVSFVVDRANLDRLTLLVMVDDVPLGGTGYELRVKDFVDLKKVR